MHRFFNIIIPIESAAINYFYSFFCPFLSFFFFFNLFGRFSLCPWTALLFSRFLPLTDSYSILEIAKCDENVTLCKQPIFCPGVFLHLVNVAADVYYGSAFLQSQACWCHRSTLIVWQDRNPEKKLGQSCVVFVFLLYLFYV